MIRELRILCAAHEAALQFDYCPGMDQLDFLCENAVKPHTREDYKAAIVGYEGWSPSNITDEMKIIVIGDETQDNIDTQRVTKIVKDPVLESFICQTFSLITALLIIHALSPDQSKDVVWIASVVVGVTSVVTAIVEKKLNKVKQVTNH